MGQVRSYSRTGAGHGSMPGSDSRHITAGRSQEKAAFDIRSGACRRTNGIPGVSFLVSGAARLSSQPNAPVAPGVVGAAGTDHTTAVPGTLANSGVRTCLIRPRPRQFRCDRRTSHPLAGTSQPPDSGRLLTIQPWPQPTRAVERHPTRFATDPDRPSSAAVGVESCGHRSAQLPRGGRIRVGQQTYVVAHMVHIVPHRRAVRSPRCHTVRSVDAYAVGPSLRGGCGTRPICAG